MDEKKYSISAFFPVYNDWATIPSMVLLVSKALKQYAKDYEIILVDDGSNKLTRDVLEELEKRIENIKVIYHEKNRGYGGALKSGIYSAKYELIFYTDGDAQYNPLEIIKLLDVFNDDVDIVNGYKISRSDPVYRKVIGKFYHFVTKIMFGFKIMDVDCDFRLMRKSLFDDIDLEYSSGMICVEMITKLSMKGARFAEVGVNHFVRSSGRSQFFNFKRIFNTGMDLLRLWKKLRIKKEL